MAKANPTRAITSRQSGGKTCTLQAAGYNGEIEDYENIKVALAQRVKAELQKSLKTGKKPNKNLSNVKSLSRRF
ncbi:MAG: hypothetical protein IE889_06870 [Campylobacterales bacterium]|nr:hypothetical protein [Campylobacterales bacterium]